MLCQKARALYTKAQRRKGPDGALGTPNKEQNGTNKEQNWGKVIKMGPIGVLSFMKIPLVSLSLDQKEQNCFGHPQFFSSIAPMWVDVNTYNV